jgi:hypothetical protein
MLVSVVSAALANFRRVSLVEQQVHLEIHTGHHRLNPTSRPPYRLSSVDLWVVFREVMALKVKQVAPPIRAREGLLQ